MGVYSRTITNRGICTTRGSHSVIIKDLFCEEFPMGVYSRTITNTYLRISKTDGQRHFACYKTETTQLRGGSCRDRRKGIGDTWRKTG